MMPPRWSCSIRSFPLAPLDLAFRIVSGLGFDAVDLCVSPDSSADAVTELCARWSLQVADVRLDAPERDAIRFARHCAASVVTLPWAVEDGPEVLLTFATLAAELGVSPSIEARPGTTPDAIAQAASIHGVGVTLDYGTFLSAGISESEVNRLLPVAVHLRVRGVATGAYQTSWAENTVDYAQAIETLRSRGYTGYLAADYVWEPASGRNRNDTISETAQMLRQLGRSG